MTREAEEKKEHPLLLLLLQQQAACCMQSYDRSTISCKVAQGRGMCGDSTQADEYVSAVAAAEAQEPEICSYASCIEYRYALRTTYPTRKYHHAWYTRGCLIYQRWKNYPLHAAASSRTMQCVYSVQNTWYVFFIGACVERWRFYSSSWTKKFYRGTMNVTNVLCFLLVYCYSLCFCAGFSSHQEVEALTLYRAIVEDGPDLFSCHRVELDAPFTWVKKRSVHQFGYTQSKVRWHSGQQHIHPPLGRVSEPVKWLESLHT